MKGIKKEEITELIRILATSLFYSGIVIEFDFESGDEESYKRETFWFDDANCGKWLYGFQSVSKIGESAWPCDPKTQQELVVRLQNLEDDASVSLKHDRRLSAALNFTFTEEHNIL